MSSKPILNKISDHFFSMSDEKSKLTADLKILKQQLKEQKENVDKLTSKIENKEKRMDELNTLTETLRKENEVKISDNLLLSNKLKVYEDRFGIIETVPHPTSDLFSPTDSDANILYQLIKFNGGNEFSAEQLAAIRFDMKNHLRIIAGVGSGKTQTICAKAAYLVQYQQIKEESIVMCTFSNKAAQEMNERVVKYMNGNNKIKVKTFHSWFNHEVQILKEKFPHLSTIGVPGKIENEKIGTVIKTLIKKYKLYNFDKFEDTIIAKRLSYWINMGFTDTDIIHFIEEHFDKENFFEDTKLSTVFKLFLDEFETIKRSEGIISFDDMMNNLKLILETDEIALKYIRDKYRYIFIDEFQDINPLQKRIVELICPPDKENGPKSKTKLIIVGDDDQSIYYFRGAEPKYIKEFDQEYEQTSLSLMTNYRSNLPIVQAGNVLIQNNEHDRISKSMVANNKDISNDCFIAGFEDENSEANWINDNIFKLAEKEEPFAFDNSHPNYSDILVLYPTKLQLRSLMKYLTIKNIPFVIKVEGNLLGIFSIKLFKVQFDLLKKARNAKNKQEKEEVLKELIQQYASCFYIKYATSASFANRFFANEQYTDENISEVIVNFLGKERRLSNKEKYSSMIFFEQVESLLNHNDLDLKKNADSLINTRKFKADLDEEELLWLKNELYDKVNWKGLSDYYQQTVTQNDNMKKRLAEYDNGRLNAVCLMTIHSSKGLGKKNVFVRGVYDGSLPNHRSLPKNKCDLKTAIERAKPPSILEEQRRLMYVAITRAKKNLYITYPRTVNEKPTIMSEFIKESNMSVRNY